MKGKNTVFLAFLLVFAAGASYGAAPDAVAVSEEADDGFGDFGEFGEEGEGKKVYDPLNGYNRVMFKVNDKFYFWLVRPLAIHYRFFVHKKARTSVNNAFHNVQFPLRFANNLLQLKFKKAGTEFGRFLVNSTAGVGGLLDPAGRYLQWHASDEDFGQTLARYGVGEGFPVVVPLLGPTNLRDGLCLIPQGFANPVAYFASWPVTLSVATGEKFNYASLHVGEYESVKKDALDPYTFIRDAYKQNRDKQIQE